MFTERTEAGGTDGCEYGDDQPPVWACHMERPCGQHHRDGGREGSEFGTVPPSPMGDDHGGDLRELGAGAHDDHGL
jgi:hypothetical protein